MRQTKPKIRAPKIAVLQEIAGNQQTTVQPSSRPYECVLPSESFARRLLDFLHSRFSRNFLAAIGGIVILVVMVLAIDGLTSWWKVRGRLHHLTAVAFELPPEIETPRVPVSGKPSVYNAGAEACYIEGNRLMASGHLYRAEKMFRQAAEQNPDEQKYWNAWQIIRLEADFKALRLQMESLLEADRHDEAWEAYVDGVRRDRRFFNSFTPDFAERLVKVGHPASAAAILMTYNELFPVNPKTRSLLEQIRKTP